MGAPSLSPQENERDVLERFFARCSEARELIDINVAAGMAEEELRELEGHLNASSGHKRGTPLIDALKPV